MASVYYKYQWDIYFYIKELDLKIKPLKIEQFVKTLDFHNNESFLPILKMELKIEEIHLKYFRKYENQITCHVTKTRISGPSSEVFNESTVIESVDYIPLYDKRVIPNYMRNDIDLSQGKDYELFDDQIEKLNSHSIVFTLIRIEDTKLKKYMHNYILDDATVTDAISLIVSENPYVKKVLIDIPDNTFAYPNIIIPPLELKNALRHLQTRYGIYATGMVTFLDNGILYILKKVSTEHAFQKDEITLIELDIDEDFPTGKSVDYVSENETQILYDRCDRINIVDNQTVIGELVGDKIIYSNFNSVINSFFAPADEIEFVDPIREIDRVNNTHEDSGTKIISDYDMLNNDFNMTSYITENGVGIPVNVTIQACNTEHFAPNKNIKLVLNNDSREELYGGIYTISSMQMFYKNTLDPKEFFTTNAACTMILNYKT